jgi:hypothetical protein
VVGKRDLNPSPAGLACGRAVGLPLIAALALVSNYCACAHCLLLLRARTIYCGARALSTAVLWVCLSSGAGAASVSGASLPVLLAACCLLVFATCFHSSFYLLFSAKMELSSPNPSFT